MVELLGPNMARNLMGAAYNPQFRYELETDDDGFHVIVTDTESGKQSSVKLDPEEVDPNKLTPIWSDDLSSRTPKPNLLSKLLFWFCMASMLVCIVAALLCK